MARTHRGGDVTPVFAMTPPPEELPVLPVWLQVTVISVNCMFGAMLARGRDVPVFGTLLAGVLVGLGGGIFRDMMLGIEPAAIRFWYYLPFGILLATIGAFGYRLFARFPTPMLALNAVVLGSLVTIGAQKALSYQTPWISAMFLGVITASFGGLLADDMAGERATIAKQAHWVGSALACGAVVFVIVVHFLPFWAAVLVGGGTTAALRFTSQFRNWPSPSWPGETQHTTN
jgi:uncharacterized membrane protein YeiH